MYCSKCGHANPDNSRFCEQCGTPLQAGQQTPPTGQHYPPTGPGGGYQPPRAATTTPIWVLVSVIAGAAIILGFVLPWMSVGMFGFGVRSSGLTFIFYLFATMFSGALGYLNGGLAFLVVIAMLIIIGILVMIPLMAVKIILAGAKILSNHMSLPGDSNQAAEKIKRYSIIGLIAIGAYFILVMAVLGPIMFNGMISMSTLAFGFWLCLIGFVAALLGATVVKQRF